MGRRCLRISSFLFRFSPFFARNIIRARLFVIACRGITHLVGRVTLILPNADTF